MTIESATTIAELNLAWPLFNDPVGEGDDVLRLLKEVPRSQFIGAGTGFDVPITTTAAQLNFSQNVTSDIQQQFADLNTAVDTLADNLSAPPGTLLMFGEAFVPTGWTIQHYGDTYSLVIVDPSQGNTPGWRGGTDDPITYTAAHTHMLTPSPTIKARIGTDIVILGEDVTQGGGVDWNPLYLEAVIAEKD